MAITVDSIKKAPTKSLLMQLQMNNTRLESVIMTSVIKDICVSNKRLLDELVNRLDREIEFNEMGIGETEQDAIDDLTDKLESIKE